MIKVNMGHGDFKRQLGQSNRESVKKFFLENPNATKVDCSKELGLAWLTVARHVKAILKEQGE